MTPELLAYFRKLYVGKCPHVILNGQGYCLKHRCLARRGWIRFYRQAMRVPLQLTDHRRNVVVLDAIEGIQFHKED